MSDFRMNGGRELSQLSSTIGSRNKDKSAADQITFLNTTETDHGFAHAQDTPVITENDARISWWPYKLLRHDGPGRYFSLLDPKNGDPPTRGWRKTVMIASAVTGIVLLTNVVLMIVASVRYPVHSDGVGLIYSGSCDRVNRWDTALHLMINLLGTVLLAASSFTMQCLSSPTRREVDAAHAKRVSLKIGVPSFTNLFYVRRWKAVVWLLLCLSTLPLHLLWNSTVFTTQPKNFFSVVVANQAFLQGANYLQLDDSAVTTCIDPAMQCSAETQSCNTTRPTQVARTLHDDYNPARYSNLTATECLNVYTDDIGTTRRNLIVLVQQPTPSDRMTGCGFSNFASKENGSITFGNPVMWNGSSVVGIAIDVFTSEATKVHWGYDNWMLSLGIEHLPALHDLQSEVNSTGTWPLGDFRVEACLSEDIVGLPCDLQFLPSFLYIVVTCNVVKLACMCITLHYLWDREEPILATVGDAVSSYLEHPDKTTRGLCLIDHRDRRRGASPLYDSTYSRRPKRRLYFATTDLRWWATILGCAGFVVVGWFLWSIPLGLGRRIFTFRESMRLTFGGIDGTTSDGVEWLHKNVFRDIVVANTFQVALSITYFLYNFLWTAQCGALEWASYIRGEKKGLRVTCPRGQQRSTYYLQLPYRYSVPLIVFSVSIHFLVSQSVFLARIQQFNWLGVRVNDGLMNYLDYSPPAIFTTCTIGTILVLIQVAHACRPLDNRIPTHGNDSAVVSAMCHPGRCDDNELNSSGLPSDAVNTCSIALRPLTWGVTRQPNDLVDGSSVGLDPDLDEAGHCTFSADTVDMPEIGKKYR